MSFQLYCGTVLIQTHMNLWTRYYSPTSIDEALKILHEPDRQACLIAGGTDLLLDLRQGRHTPVDCLVDVNQIHELQIIEQRGHFLFIGAAVPLQKILDSELIRTHAEVLYDSICTMGSPQVRNMATLGGNIAHALPAADGAISLTVLESQVEIASVEGPRRIPLSMAFEGPGRSAINSKEEIIVGFYIPSHITGCASAFSRIMRPQGVALPILNMAIWLNRKEDTIYDIRIAVGPSAPIPQRCELVEDAIRGRLKTQELTSQVQDLFLSQVLFRSSRHRASAEYRKQIACRLFNDVLDIAWDRAGRSLIN